MRANPHMPIKRKGVKRGFYFYIEKNDPQNNLALNLALSVHNFLRYSPFPIQQQYRIHKMFLSYTLLYLFIISFVIPRFNYNSNIISTKPICK